MDNLEAKLTSVCDHIRLTMTKSCPSLLKLALVSAATSLWSQEHVKSKITAYFTKINEDIKMNTEDWLEIEESVSKEANKSQIPAALKSDLVYVIEAIGVQINDWAMYLNRFTWSDDTTSGDYVNTIAWTMHGTIDREKTFYLLLNEQNLRQNGSLYNLACNFCLKEQILALLEPQGSVNGEPGRAANMDLTFSVIVRKYLSEPFNLSYLDDDTLLEQMTLFEHDLAVAYFWRSTPAEHRPLMIDRIWGVIHFHLPVHIVQFLLCHSSDEQVKKYIRSHLALTILWSVLFAVKPWQIFDQTVIIHLVNFISNFNLQILVGVVHEKVARAGLWRVVYKPFLMQLWNRGDDWIKAALFHLVCDFGVIKCVILDDSDKTKFKILLCQRSSCVFSILSDGGLEFDAFVKRAFRDKSLVRKLKEGLSEFAVLYVNNVQSGNAETMKGLLQLPVKESRFLSKFGSYESVKSKISTYFNSVPNE